MKAFIAATTIIMFEYKPQLWVVPSLVVMLGTVLKLKVFQVYERLALLMYLLGMVTYLICMMVFWVDYFFNTWVVIVVLFSSVGFFVLLVSELADWSREKQGRYWQVAFAEVDGEEVGNEEYLASEELEQEVSSYDGLVK